MNKKRALRPFFMAPVIILVLLCNLAFATVHFEPEFLEKIKQEYGEYAKRRIVSWEKLPDWRAAMRTAGKRLVVTNGCFDLLHLGHVTYLESGHNLGNALFNDKKYDDAVKAYTRALKSVPQDGDAKHNLELALRALEQKQQQQKQQQRNKPDQQKKDDKHAVHAAKLLTHAVAEIELALHVVHHYHKHQQQAVAALKK